MLTRATATTAVTVVAAIATTTAAVVWATGTTTAALTASTTALVSALFVPLLTSRYELEHNSSTAHEGGKPKWAVLHDYVKTELLLIFKQPVINKCVNGIPFLGFLIRRNSISILSRNWKRKLIKVAQLDKYYSEERESDEYNRYSSMFACLAMCQELSKKIEFYLFISQNVPY